MKQKDGEVRGLLQEGCDLLDLSVDAHGIAALTSYYEELVRWGQKINLVGKKQSCGQIIENHFLDSLILLKYLQGEKYTLVDVGSGAGFPGLVCKAVLPDLRLVLVEPRLKRVSFLLHMVRKLGLSEVEVLAKRIEEIDPGSLLATHITSRAVAEIAEFLPMISNVAADDTKILCMKGPKWQQELEQAASCLNDLQISLRSSDEFSLPFSTAKRFVLTFQRINV